MTEQTLTAKQGDTLDIVVTWRDGSGTLVDLSGASVEFGIAVKPGSSRSFQYTTDDYITISGTGEITVSIPSEETKKWTYRRMVYELTVTDSSNKVTTIAGGRLLIDPEVVL